MKTKTHPVGQKTFLCPFPPLFIMVCMVSILFGSHQFGMKYVLKQPYFWRPTALFHIHCPAKTWIYLAPYAWTERIFDSRLFMHNKIFRKNSCRNLSSKSLRFFWYILRPNWSIIRCTMILWSMFKNQQIALIEGKCHRFWNSSDSKSTSFSFENSDFTVFMHFSKTRCASKNWPVWTQKVPKEA